jgi:hypothetical protein
MGGCTPTACHGPPTARAGGSFPLLQPLPGGRGIGESSPLDGHPRGTYVLPRTELDAYAAQQNTQPASTDSDIWLPITTDCAGADLFVDTARRPTPQDNSVLVQFQSVLVAKRSISQAAQIINDDFQSDF